MQDLKEVFLFDFWRSANAFSRQDRRTLRVVQDMFIKAVHRALSVEPGAPPSTQETGFRILNNVLNNVKAPVLRQFAHEYQQREQQDREERGRRRRPRPPSPELPVHDGSGSEHEEKEEEEEDKRPMSLDLSPLSSFSHRQPASFGGGGGGGGGREGTASIPDYFEDDWRDIEASRRRREAEAEADAIYQRTYEELEQQKKRERQEWQEEQQRRRMNRRRRQPVAVVPSAPAPTTATTTTTTGDVVASIPAFQTDMWQRDENLMSQLAIQPPERLRAIGKSSFMRHIAAKARDSY